jgi:hypothetical protein
MLALYLVKQFGSDAGIAAIQPVFRGGIERFDIACDISRITSLTPPPGATASHQQGAGSCGKDGDLERRGLEHGVPITSTGMNAK